VGVLKFKKMDKNEVKKDLYKSKEMADFSHYISGNLYYNIKVGFDIYQFPIPTVEKVPYNAADESENTQLSSDLGTTTFGREMRGSHLIRWIDKAIDNGEFVMVEVAVSPI
jgi:hypothetical protein